MGGLAAETLIFGENELFTTGTSPDFDFSQAFALAMEIFGYSTEVGSVGHNKWINMGSETMQLIAKEATDLLISALKNACTILTTHEKELHALANALLEHETLTGSQIKDLLANDKSQQQQQPQSGAVEV
jgi:ATP-dependent metalloprotease